MKRTKRKQVLFTREQWELVCKRAESVKMKPATYLRNMSLHKEWKNCSVEEFCVPIRISENTNSEHLPKLRELKTKFEEYRNIFFRYYSQLMNGN